MFDGYVPQRFISFDQRAALRAGQIWIGLNRLNHFCRPVRWLVAAEQIGRNIEGLSDCLQYLYRRDPEATFDLGEIRVRDPGHRRDLTHRQLGQLSLPADDLAKS